MDAWTRGRIVRSALVLASAFLVSCGDSPTLDPTLEVVRIELSPKEGSLEIGEEISLEVVAFNGRDEVVRSVEPSFRSSASEVASVSKEGVVRGIRQGSAQITAEVKGKKDTATFTVKGTVASIAIAPNPVELLTKDSVKLEAIAYDGNGNRLEGKKFRWSVENDRVATVAGDGTLTALRREQETEVIAVADNVEGRARVIVRKKVATVEIVPSAPRVREKDTLQLQAIARGDGGEKLEGRKVAWSSEDPEIATVDEKGLLLGVRPGTTGITATVEGVSATVDLEVRPARVVSIQIEPADVTVAVGATQQFVARTFDKDGVELFGRQLKWQSEDPETLNHGKAELAAPVDQTGLLEAKRPFRGQVRVSVEGDAAFAVATFKVVLRSKAVAAGRFHTCALTGSNEAWCWGQNSVGELGRSPDNASRLPGPVETSLRFVSISAGSNHSCGLTEEGAAWCWGGNAFGQLGNGDKEESVTPVRVERPVGAAPFVDIYAGDDYSCAIDSDAQAWCWGQNREGRLGDGSAITRYVPSPVSGEIHPGGGVVPIRFRFLSLGSNPDSRNVTTCGISIDDVGYCWGENEISAYGIGAGQTLFSSQPMRLEGGLSFRTISVGREHSCGLTTEGKPYCWGHGLQGQLGDGKKGTGHHSLVPVAAQTDVLYDLLVSGGEETCALTDQGEIDCWGRPPGKLSYDVPSRVGMDSEWIFVTASKGETHTCAINQDFVVYCWGDNVRGQLGNTRTDSPITEPVAIFPETAEDW